MIPKIFGDRANAHASKIGGTMEVWNSEVQDLMEPRNELGFQGNRQKFVDFSISEIV